MSKRYSTQFSRLPIGTEFRLGGTRWVKVSTKTAKVVGEDVNRTFYFSKDDNCVITAN